MEPKEASRKATWNGACSHLSFDPSPGMKMLRAVEERKVITHKGRYQVKLMNMIINVSQELPEEAWKHKW